MSSIRRVGRLLAVVVTSVALVVAGVGSASLMSGCGGKSKSEKRKIHGGKL